MQEIWFTADTHFGHANIIKYSGRPFDSVEEMDERLIKAWNEVVRPNHVVWHLGDFNFKGARDTAYYRRRLAGDLHIVWGNHDDKCARRPEFRHLFGSAQEMKYLRVGGEKITLYHYAQRVWRNSHHGAWHLYGHSHGCIPDDWGRSMDVGVDAGRRYRPVSFDEVRAALAGRPVTLHHPGMDTADDADET